MSTVTLASASTFRLSPRRPLTVMALFGLLVLGLCVAFPGHALDLVAFVGIAGPLTAALAQIAALGPGIKALVGFVGFVVALICLAPCATSARSCSTSAWPSSLPWAW